jgi:hypothetical protein
MTMYHVIKPDGTVTSEDYVGPLKYGTPAWSTFRQWIGLDEDDLIEHVSVLWKGKKAHMFVDEEGRMHNLLINKKATAIYYNYTLQRHRFHTYNDLSKDPDPAELLAVMEPGFDIVGTAILWEGDME